MAEPGREPLRVCVDLNVFVAAERALQRPSRGSLPERVLEAIEHGEIILVASLNMFERLQDRLEDVRPPSRVGEADLCHLEEHKQMVETIQVP